MWWRKAGGLLLALGVLGGCGADGYDRAQYAVGSVGGVLFSNSLVVTRQVLPQRSANGGLSLEYALLFQNEGASSARLGLADAYAKLDGEPDLAQVRCGAHGSSPSPALDIAPGQRLRVDCRLSLTPEGLVEARISDRELLLAVPLLSGGQLVTLSFTYRLKLEDAS
jgi:hypothetical protein